MSSSAKVFTDLIAWQKAHRFVLEVYRYTEGFAKSETYGSTTQFRRAAISIPANIAEGFRKQGKADKARFYNIAQGSLEECRYYLILAGDLGFGDTTDLMSLLDALAKSMLKSNSSTPRPLDYLTTPRRDPPCPHS